MQAARRVIAYLPDLLAQPQDLGLRTQLSLAALECGVDTVLAAEPLGGMAALREGTLPSNVRVHEFYFRAGSMKGVAMKAGQALSVVDLEAVPPAYRDEVRDTLAICLVLERCEALYALLVDKVEVIVFLN